MIYKKLLMLFAAVILVIPGCRGGRPVNEVFTADDVPGKTIGAIYGSPSLRLADELGDLVVFQSRADMLEGLRDGVVDCVIMESADAAELAGVASGVRVLPDSILEYDLRYAVAKENNELLQTLNDALEALHANGVLKGLQDRYFSNRNYTYSPPTDVPQRPGTLILAVPPNVFPYSYWTEYGEIGGFNIEVTRAVCDYLGVEMEIIEIDAGQLVTAVWFGTADLALGWLPDDVDGQVSISEPYAYAYHSIIVRR